MSIEPIPNSAVTSTSTIYESMGWGTNAAVPSGMNAATVRRKSVSVLRVISRVAGALTALSLFLLGLPGDRVPIELVYGVGAASVFMSALAGNLSVSEP